MCDSGCALNMVPDPNARSGGGGGPISNARGRRFRRQRIYSPGLQRASDVLQRPRSISLRELAVVLFAVFALRQGYFAAERLYDLLARRDVGAVCRGATAMQCLRFHLWRSLYVLFDWGGAVLPWGVVGAVAVFFGEELLARLRSP